MKWISKLFIISILFIIPIKVYAEEYSTCTYSKAYKEYLELSEEEKEQIIMPAPCEKTKAESIMNNITSNNMLKMMDIPESYDLREEYALSDVRNQQNTNTCWTFSTTANYESFIRKKYFMDEDFSERHMEYSTSRTFKNNEINVRGFNRELDDGGNFYISTAYYMNLYGPIDEYQMPFIDSKSKIDLSELDNKNIYYETNEIIHIENEGGCSSVSQFIKQYILTYGALATGIYMSNSPSYLNYYTYGYYYNGNALANHAVNIVGWDDNYSISNFSSSNKPSTKGAWIVRNSYGEEWGDDGYFYVSYNDNMICDNFSGITDVDYNIPDTYYNYDIYGYNNSIGNDYNNVGYTAVVFDKQEEVEYLEEVKIGSEEFSIVDLYLVDKNNLFVNGNLNINLSNETFLGTKTIYYGGYTTFKLPKRIKINNDQFAIVARYTTASKHPIPASFQVPGTIWGNLEVPDNTNFVSMNGTNFQDANYIIENYNNMAIPIKVGTFESGYYIKQQDDINNINVKEGKIIDLTLETDNIDDDEDYDVTIYDSNYFDVSNRFGIDKENINNNKSDLTLTVYGDFAIEYGVYHVVVEYLDEAMVFDLIINDYKLLESINVGDIYVYEGEEATLNITMYPNDADNKDLTYTYDNKMISITNKTLKGISNGNTTVTVTNELADVSTTFNVTIVDGIVHNTSYNIINSNVITNINTNTSVTNFKNYLNNMSSYKVLDLNNNEVYDGIIKTGYKVIKITQKNTSSNYGLVVPGDTNSDGKISALDYVRIKNDIMNTNKISDYYQKIAADINGDNKISALDYVRIKNHIMSGGS